MADSKISALPASTTPLAGTEVLPIVQSSTTKQVSVANLTTGRAVDALTFTPTSAPSSNWAINGTNAGLLVTIANDGTYDLATGSGAVYAWDNGGNGVGIFYTFYGTVSPDFNPSAFYSTTVDTPLLVNFYYNAGTGTYRFQNKTGSSKSIYIFTMKFRASS